MPSAEIPVKNQKGRSWVMIAKIHVCCQKVLWILKYDRSMILDIGIIYIYIYSGNGKLIIKGFRLTSTRGIFGSIISQIYIYIYTYNTILYIYRPQLISLHTHRKMHWKTHTLPSAASDPTPSHSWFQSMREHSSSARSPSIHNHETQVSDGYTSTTMNIICSLGNFARIAM